MGTNRRPVWADAGRPVAPANTIMAAAMDVEIVFEFISVSRPSLKAKLDTSHAQPREKGDQFFSAERLVTGGSGGIDQRRDQVNMALPRFLLRAIQKMFTGRHFSVLQHQLSKYRPGL